MEEYMLPCLTKTHLGFECFGCGIQRAIALIFQGEFVSAFYMYPAVYTLIILFGVFIFQLFKKTKFVNKIMMPLVIVNLVIVVSSFIFKTFIAH